MYVSCTMVEPLSVPTLDRVNLIPAMFRVLGSVTESYGSSTHIHLDPHPSHPTLCLHIQGIHSQSNIPATTLRVRYQAYHNVDNSVIFETDGGQSERYPPRTIRRMSPFCILDYLT